MSATGTGALSTLLGSEKDNKGARKTNTREIATVISETLVNLAQQKNSKVVFILDDTQWMDRESFELFGLLLEIAFQKNLPKTSVVLSLPVSL